MRNNGFTGLYNNDGYTEEAGSFDSTVYVDGVHIMLHNDIKLDITGMIKHAFEAGQHTNESFDTYVSRLQGVIDGMGA